MILGAILSYCLMTRSWHEGYLVLLRLLWSSQRGPLVDPCTFDTYNTARSFKNRSITSKIRTLTFLNLASIDLSPLYRVSCQPLQLWYWKKILKSVLGFLQTGFFRTVGFSDTSVKILAFGTNITKEPHWHNPAQLASQSFSDSVHCVKTCWCVLPGIYTALGFQQPLPTSLAPCPTYTLSSQPFLHTPCIFYFYWFGIHKASVLSTAGTSTGEDAVLGKPKGSPAWRHSSNLNIVLK